MKLYNLITFILLLCFLSIAVTAYALTVSDDFESYQNQEFINGKPHWTSGDIYNFGGWQVEEGYGKYIHFHPSPWPGSFVLDSNYATYHITSTERITSLSLEIEYCVLSNSVMKVYISGDNNTWIDASVPLGISQTGEGNWRIANADLSSYISQANITNDIYVKFTASASIGFDWGAHVASITLDLTTLPQRIPVVLVHGINGSPASFGQLKMLLEAEGYDVKEFPYSSTSVYKNKRIENCAYQLGQFIASDAQVDIIAHSMGGLITRAYRCGLSSDYFTDGHVEYKDTPHYDKIRKFIMIGAPNAGTNRAGIGIDLLQLFMGGDDSLFQQMNWASEIVWRINLQDRLGNSDYVIAGLYDPFSPLSSDNDGVVWLQSATPPWNLKDIPTYYVPYPHIKTDLWGYGLEHLGGIADISDAYNMFGSWTADTHESWIIIKGLLSDNFPNPTYASLYNKGAVIFGAYENANFDSIYVVDPQMEPYIRGLAPRVVDGSGVEYPLTGEGYPGPVWYKADLPAGEYTIDVVKKTDTTKRTRFSFDVKERRCTFLSVDFSGPSPEVKADLSSSSFDLALGQEKTVTFTVKNKGLPTSLDAYLTISVSNGLEIVNWSSDDGEYNSSTNPDGMHFFRAMPGDTIHDRYNNRITATDMLLDCYEAFDTLEKRTITVTFRTITEGEQWIKYRATFDDAGEGINYVNYPKLESGDDVDQQGWEVFKTAVNVNVTTLINHSPDKPTNLAPSGTDVSLTPTLQATPFYDIDGDSHYYTQWMVRLALGDYLNPVYSGRWFAGSGNLTSFTLPSGALDYGKAYCWRVRYADEHGKCSEWSDETTFSTIAPAYVTVTADTNFASGTKVIVDSVEYDAPVTFTDWVSGRSKTISVESPQYVSSNQRYIFSSWNDGGSQTHSVAPTSNAHYTAYLRNQYRPIIMLNGTDSIHTVSVTYTQAGVQHTDVGIQNTWSDWCDEGTTLSFSQFTTGMPPKEASNTCSWTVDSALSNTIGYLFPTVTITQPNGGETIQGGGQDNFNRIRWTAFGSIIDHIKLVYSTDGGSSYPYTIVENTPNDGFYEWTTPALNSNTIKIKAIAENNNHNVLCEDESDGNFQIVTYSSMPFDYWDRTDLPHGTVTLPVSADSNYNIFDFSSGVISHADQVGDLYFVYSYNSEASYPCIWRFYNPTGAIERYPIPSTYRNNLSDYDPLVTVDYYNSSVSMHAQPNQQWSLVLFIKTQEGNYAKLKIIEATQEHITFNWVYQPNGTNNFPLNISFASVYGKVTDSSNNPIKDVNINCWVENVDVSGSGDTTDENGDYSFRYLLPGYTYTLEVRPPPNTNYIMKRLKIDVPTAGDYPLNITLESGAIKISGNVIDAATQNPLQGIQISYWNSDHQIWRDTSTDENGNYTLTNLPTGEASITARPSSTYAWDGIEKDFQTDDVVNFALVSESTLSGIIKDADTGEVITGLLELNYGNDKRHIWKQLLTTDGTFTFSGLPEGIAHIRARPPVNPTEEGYPWEMEYLYLSQGENKTGFVISLKKSPLVSISAKDASNPLQGLPFARLFTMSSMGNADEWYGKTDANGNAQIRLAPERTHRVYFENEEGDEWVGFPQEFIISNPTDNKTVQLTGYNSTTASYITGNVIASAAKNPNAFFEVCAFSTTEVINKDTMRYISPIRYVFPESSGSYSLMLPPDNNYMIVLILTHEDENDLRSFTVRDVLSSISTGPSGSTTGNQDLYYTSEGGTITGTITYNGQPLLMAQIYLRNLNGQMAGVAETDQNGVYHLYNVPAGDYIASAWYSDYGNSIDFTVSGVTDGGTVQTDIDIAVTNHPPILNPISDKTVNRGDWLKFSVSATDAEGEDIIYYIYNQPEGSTFSTDTGEFRWRPRIEQAGDFEVTFVAEDTAGNQDSEIITITVPNNSPVLEPIGNKTAIVGEWLRFRLDASDADTIDSAHLRYFAENLSQGADFNSHNGQFRWRPEESQRGSYQIRFYVQDPPGAIGEETITIIIE